MARGNGGDGNPLGRDTRKTPGSRLRLPMNLLAYRLLILSDGSPSTWTAMAAASMSAADEDPDGNGWH